MSTAIVTGYCVLDIVLVVDTSSSIQENQPPGVNDVQLIKDFLKRLLSKPLLEIGLHFDRVGLVSFESTARTLFDLDARTSRDAVKNGIDLLPLPHGESNIPDAINMARQVHVIFSCFSVYSAKASVVGTLAVDGRTVTFGTARRRLGRPQPAQDPSWLHQT